MDAKAAAHAFASELREEFGLALRSATLFGSAARGEHIAGLSDVNVLLLFTDINAPTLARAAPVVRRHAAEGLNPLPLEREEWERARDVFAIELLDMRDAREVLFGADPLDGVEVEPAALRLQAERELRAKLITLHGGLLQAADSPDAIGELLRRALPSFATYLRTALRLCGEAAPVSTRDAIIAGCERVGAEPEGLLAALDARLAPKRRWSVRLEDETVERYNDAVEKTATFVDEIQIQENDR